MIMFKLLSLCSSKFLDRITLMTMAILLERGNPHVRVYPENDESNGHKGNF